MPLTLVASHLKRNLEPLLADIFQPPRLSRLATRLPQGLNRLVVANLLNRAFAEQISDGDFNFLGNRLLQVELIDAGLFVGVGFTNDKLICRHFSAQSRQSDATLSIDTLSAIQLVKQEVDPDTLFFHRKLKINGDTELAHHVKNTIDTLDPQVIPRFILALLNQYSLRVLQADV